MDINANIEQAVLQVYLEALQKTHPDKEFKIQGGDIVVTLIDPMVSLIDTSMSDQSVAGHYRADGTYVEGYTRRGKVPTVLDIAKAMVAQDNNPTSDIDLEVSEEEFIRRVSQPNSLQNKLQ